MELNKYAFEQLCEKARKRTRIPYTNRDFMSMLRREIEPNPLSKAMIIEWFENGFRVYANDQLKTSQGRMWYDGIDIGTVGNAQEQDITFMHEILEKYYTHVVHHGNFLHISGINHRFIEALAIEFVESGLVNTIKKLVRELNI